MIRERVAESVSGHGPFQEPLGDATYYAQTACR
jgi:hypothetical protein